MSINMFKIFDRPPPDPSNLFLCTSPWPMVMITSFYLMFVLKLGPKLMANREAFEMRRLLQLYNLMQILYNAVVFVIGTYFTFELSSHKLPCLVVMDLNHPWKELERQLSYAYYINKYIDLLDTVFIVLRKSYRQISMLHLIHHVVMPISGYFVLRFNGFGGHVIVMGLLNLFVHVVMYSYYYLSARKPNMKRKIWWKQYITVLQMLQFVIIFGHSAWTLMQPKCGVSRFLAYMVLFMSSTMFTMFTNFYIHAYILPKRQAATKLKLK